MKKRNQIKIQHLIFKIRNTMKSKMKKKKSKSKRKKKMSKKKAVRKLIGHFCSINLT
jgi:hypothetical protein